jgi:hypothetical protein
VPIAHADKTALGQTGNPPLIVMPAGATNRYAVVHLQLLVVRQDLNTRVTQPWTTFRSNRKAQPDGCLDQALVFHLSIRHLDPLPVIHPCYRCRDTGRHRTPPPAPPPVAKYPLTSVHSASRWPSISESTPSYSHTHSLLCGGTSSPPPTSLLSVFIGPSSDDRLGQVEPPRVSGASLPHERNFSPRRRPPGLER